MEWLKDKEKRLLFTALRREKEHCKELIDSGDLVSIVDGLEKKFYYDKIFKEIEAEVYNRALDDFAMKAGIRIQERNRGLYFCELADIVRNLKKEGET